MKAAKTGDHSVALYDSEGYTAVKRSRERGEAATTAPLVITTNNNNSNNILSPRI